MEEHIMKLMLDMRDTRLKELRSKTLETRSRLLHGIIKTLAPVDDDGRPLPVPNSADLYHHEKSFETILDTPLTDEEKDPVTEDTLKDALADFPRICEEWNAKNRAALLAKLPSSSEVADPDDNSGDDNNKERDKGKGKAKDELPPDPLALATSLFICNRCGTGIYNYDDPLPHIHHASNALAHHFTHYPFYHATHRTAVIDPNHDVHQMLKVYPSVGYLENTMKYHPKSVARAKTLVYLAGFSPERATLEDMDAKDARFMCDCKHCRSLRDVDRVVMTWREAVRALMLSHPPSPPTPL